ncbi:cyanophycinase [Sphingosinicella rhizophila]|uniref:Cyanophycinase n=1 Tax=Sphingosinicella rhizophila TaxID=3050082 RepID=A0ABU3QCT6_9SPHN|nr:cyanophycinase [Sphingosinicella sp. GR2756]MDT9600808.1 cyanophycinase [Sphingosinicella sp. GR2756]
MHEQGSKGCLIIIGGNEDRKDERRILREVAREVRGGKLVLATVASRRPEGYFDDYQRAFSDLDLGDLVELYVEDRVEAGDRSKLSVLDDAAGIFFSGGDQLRITSQIGDTGIEAKVRALYERGGVVAGTSAGASVMSETMLVKGTSQITHRIGDLHMAPGLGLIRDVIIDQHFAERGRFGRLIGAVAHNPRVLGMGIDEDTAAIVRGDRIDVIGSGAVYVVDGTHVTHSNVAEGQSDCALALHDVRVHVLPDGNGYDLKERRPISPDN